MKESYMVTSADCPLATQFAIIYWKNRTRPHKVCILHASSTYASHVRLNNQPDLLRPSSQRKQSQPEALYASFVSS